MIIVHPVGGKLVKDVFDVGERMRTALCLDGSFFETVEENLITIQALNGISRVSLADGKDGSKACEGATETLAAAAEISVGDCLLDGRMRSELRLALTSCESSHYGEVIGTTQLTGDSYPGVNAVEQMAAAICNGYYSARLRSAASAKGLQLSWSAPGDTAWADNERTLLCLVVASSSGGGTTGSVT